MRHFTLINDISRRLGKTYRKMIPFRDFVDYFLENEAQFKKVYLS